MRSERIKATLTLVITAIVNVLNVWGYAIDADVWVNAATSILSAASIAWCWWKNQNITKDAIEWQASIDEAKSAAKLAAKTKE